MSNEVSKKEKDYPPFGQRLLKAFASIGVTNKQEIGKMLGFKSKKPIYKVLDGTQPLKSEQLLDFRERTRFSIDWLLFGEDEISDNQEKKIGFNQMFENKIREFFYSEILENGNLLEKIREIAIEVFEEKNPIKETNASQTETARTVSDFFVKDIK